jgi:hypothetical protein
METTNYSMFCLDLRNFVSETDLAQFLDHTGLNMDAKFLYGGVKGLIIPCYKVDKIWIDSLTLNFIALQSNGYQTYDQKYSYYTRDLKPIDEDFTYGKIDTPYSKFCIDFTEFSSFKDFDKFVEKANLDLDSKSWWGSYVGTTIPGYNIKKVWIDAITLSLIDFELVNNTRRIIHEDFKKFMFKIKPIDLSFKYGNHIFRTREDSNLDLDTILDKILLKGIDSLTPFEKDFLNKQSQN